jgi:DNA-directed RNA polymerase beta' subunit
MELDSIQFGISSALDIERQAVCEITSHKLDEEYGALYDKRMGAINSLVDEPCMTCQWPAQSCPGHFGFLRLPFPILHPLYLKQIMTFLKIFCNSCFNLLYDIDNLQLLNIYKYKGYTRFSKIVDYSIKCNVCFHCKYTQPKISGVDGNIMKLLETGGRVQYTIPEIKHIFYSIPNDQVVLCGLNPDLVHPKSLIMTCLPILPPQSRPRICIDGVVCDDDITVQYSDIMKKMVKIDPNNPDEVAKIALKIKTIFDNSQNKVKQANGRVFKGIKERISGKDGIVRMNLLGKRVNQSARTVIGPDSTLKLGEVGVPFDMAKHLTVPENVTQYNIEEIRKLIADGSIHQMVRDELRTNIQITQVPIQVGDIIERNLRNGDRVILNRQPTLHIGSIIANKVVLLPGKNLRMPLSICKSLNADFDGDESNIHVIGTLQGINELETLASVGGNFMNPQNSTTNFNIIQDSLLAMYKMTQGFRPISNELYSNILMHTELFEIVPEKFKWIERVYIENGLAFSRGRHDGKMMFSLLLPHDFNYCCDDIKIAHGVLYSGTLVKKHLSGGQGSILFLLYKLYNVRTALDFLDGVQFISNEYFKWFSFSVGIGDCMPYKTDEIKTVIERGMMESEEIERVIENPEIREAMVNSALTSASNIGMKIARDCMGTNNFIDTITSGSKGSLFNIVQITSLLGQQCIDSSRMKPKMYGKRTMPYYQKENGEKETLFDKYESRGFVSSSFINGLNPKEFFLHACTGREGVINTSMKTASSGYSTRRLIKIAEDAVVQHDDTVRSPDGAIYQWAYGYDGLDPKCTILVDGTMQFCNVQMMVDKLHSQLLA